MIERPLILPCGVTIKNRIAKSAMSENMSDRFHNPDIRFERLYSTWAKGGSGLVISGNVMIDSKALGEANNIVIEKGHKNFEKLKAWAKAGTQNNVQLWLQLNHPGKQSPKFLSSSPVAPSAIAFKSQMKAMFNKPRELSAIEIENLIERFAYAAKVAKDAGFTGVQIHGAHGYLISQFLSPLHNKRKDKWGGSLDNRMRFVSEVYLAIRSAVGPNFPIGIKLNSADFQRGGFSEEESILVIQNLSQLGIDLFEVSGGTYEAPKMMKGKSQKKSTVAREAYFLEYCERLRKTISTPVILTGGFRSKSSMKEALDSGACEMIGLARSIALNPNFPNELLNSTHSKSLVKPLTSGIKALDKVVPLEIVWYTEQIHRLGHGKDPKPNASVLFSVVKTLFTLGPQLLKRVRAK